MTDKLALPFSELSIRLAQPSSDVWAVHYEALARKQAGEDIILLSVGDPDFDTPEFISDYVIERIKAGRTHYSPAAGEPVLRQAIAERESKNAGYPISAEQVVVFPGATTTLYATMACMLNPGEGLVLAEPLYVGYHGILECLGIERQAFELEQPGFDVSVPQVMAQIKSNTRAVLVNTPGNPCGNMIPGEVLRGLAQACRERNLWLICDEVYALMTFQDKHVSLLNCVADLDNIIVINSLSKSHAMSGWRVGWAVTSVPMAQALTRFSGSSLFGISQFVQDAGAHALQNDSAEIEPMRLAYMQRRDYVAARIRQIPGLQISLPSGGMFAMINVQGTGHDGESFSRALLDQHNIAVLPGVCFGPGTRHYVRLSLTEDIPLLTLAMDRIAELCS